jgi:two-component system NarL family sensor kinase
VALELHDTITQPLCAILLRYQSLADKLPASKGPSKSEAMKLGEMLGQTVEEVERISRDLRPSVLEHLGLVEVLRGTGTEFAKRAGMSLKLACVELPARLSVDIELTLYRIFQEALKNVEKHSRARHVTVHLTNPGDIVQLVIKDDGIGFNPDHHPTRQKGKDGLGLLGMRERASYVGGTLKIKSARRAGTEIEIRLPLPRDAQAA